MVNPYIPPSSKAANEITVGVNVYGKYDPSLKDMVVQGKAIDKITELARNFGNHTKLLKFETMLTLIFFKCPPKNKLKAVQKAEMEFSSTKWNPAERVLKPLWERVVKIKNEDVKKERKKDA